MRATWRPRQTVLAECPCRFCVARRLSRGPPTFEVSLMLRNWALAFRWRHHSVRGRRCFYIPYFMLFYSHFYFSFSFFFGTHFFDSFFISQPVAFENSRVAAPTFWKRVGGSHENCLRMARRCLHEIKAVSASRVVFVARPFFEMLGTPKGRGIGSPFFAYFLWRSKESELSPGNPRLGRKLQR
jgi:hypothetical protein